MPTNAILCLNNLGNCAYGTGFQSVICEAYLSTLPESKGSFQSMTWLACAVGGSLLLGMAIAGYVAFGDSVSSDVLMSFRPGLAGTICMSLVITQLLLYIPNAFIVMRFFGL